MTIVNTKADALPITVAAQERKIVQTSGRCVLVREPDGDRARWHKLEAPKPQ